MGGVGIGEEEAKAQEVIWRYVFGFTEMAVVKCAIDLGIADALEDRDSPISLNDLASTLKCSPSLLYRVMRFLIYRGIFKQETKGYLQTPLSRYLIRNGDKSMAAFINLESSPVMLSPWLQLSARVSMNEASAFDAVHGQDVWRYAGKNLVHSRLINDAMACHARESVPVIVDECREVFEGVKCLVDVGGGDGTTLGLLVKAFPWMQGSINFDLPHVVAAAPPLDGVRHVGGDMFDGVPQADAAFLMWVLHDWGDEDCIKILKNCREAIPRESGKVIIAEAVIDGDYYSSGGGGGGGRGETNNVKHNINRFEDAGLLLDMVMMAHTSNGKERTLEEWGNVLEAASFTRYTLNRTQTVQSLIVAYP